MLPLLAETAKLGSKLAETPIEHNPKLSESIEDVGVDRQSYHRLVGKLIHLSQTRGPTLPMF